MKKGFTLAEVLITLGIIGIIAALTIPSLVANYKEKATVVKVKKFYSMISQAYAMVQQESGDPTGWDLIKSSDVQGAQNMAEKFRPYLRVIQEHDEGNGYSFDLADGSRVRFVVRSPSCSSVRGTGHFAHTCGLVELDLRKDKSEQIVEGVEFHGVDYFQFVFSKMGIVPSGLPDDTMRSFVPDCQDYGYGCTAWILVNENMDYLKCPDELRWDGKTRCD